MASLTRSAPERALRSTAPRLLVRRRTECRTRENRSRNRRQRSRRRPSFCPPTGSWRQRRPRRSPRRPPPAATGGDAGQIGIPVTRADGWPAHGTKDASRRSPGPSPLRPPNRRPMRARSPVRSPLRPPAPGGSPTVAAGVHLVVPQTGPQVARHAGRSPRRPPVQRTSATTKTGERWEAPAGLVMHATARGAGHPRRAPPQPESPAGRVHAR
jgi:hypothetical protein